MQLLLPASVANKRTLIGHTRLVPTENPLDRSFSGWMGEILDLDLSHPPALTILTTKTIFRGILF